MPESSWAAGALHGGHALALPIIQTRDKRHKSTSCWPPISIQGTNVCLSTMHAGPSPQADQLLAPTFAEDVNYLANHCGKRTVLPKQELQQYHQQQQQQHDSSHGGEQQPAQPPAPARSPPRQTVLVSATLTPTLLSKAERWCPAPRYVTAGAAPSAAPTDAFDVLRQGGGAAAGGTAEVRGNVVVGVRGGARGVHVCCGRAEGRRAERPR